MSHNDLSSIYERLILILKLYLNKKMIEEPEVETYREGQ